MPCCLLDLITAQSPLHEALSIESVCAAHSFLSKPFGLIGLPFFLDPTDLIGPGPHHVAKCAAAAAAMYLHRLGCHAYPGLCCCGFSSWQLYFTWSSGWWNPRWHLNGRCPCWGKTCKDTEPHARIWRWVRMGLRFYQRRFPGSEWLFWLYTGADWGSRWCMSVPL